MTRVALLLLLALAGCASAPPPACNPLREECVIGAPPDGKRLQRVHSIMYL